MKFTSFNGERVEGQKWFFGPYIITGDGEIFSLIKGKYLKSTIDKGGYKKVWLTPYDKSQSRWYKVHRLIALMWVSNTDREVYKEVRHKDNRKDHNHYTNLEWVTHQQNISYSRKRATIATALE